MSIKVTEQNDVKVYNLAAGKTTPQFLEDAQKGKSGLKYNEDFRRRIELIQDFEFDTSSSRIRITKEGGHVGIIGCYPPEFRLFDTQQLGLKFLRRLDTEIVDFLFLEDDWKKVVFLCADRTIEFHAQYGKHHKLRIPKFGRTMLYDEERCCLYVGGSSNEIYRVDLEEGIFQEPLNSGLEHVNCLAKNPALPLMAAAGENGIVELWDLRDTAAPCTKLMCFMDGDDDTNGRDATCVAFSSCGMKMAVGMASGVVRVYDIRSKKPICERDHYNGLPIQSVQFHSRSQMQKEMVVSCDKKGVKFWWYNTPRGDLFTCLEGDAPILCTEMWPDSGLMFTAMEQPRVGAFFIPSLGIAPKWCSFLDSITEELEENPSTSVFDDFQFVTKEQLTSMNAAHLIGSNMLQAYMHGFFMDIRLYKKLKQVSEPFAYEEFRKKKIAEKLEAKRGMRTKEKKKLGTNVQLKELLQAKAKDVKKTSGKKKKAGEVAQNIISDDRFKKLFDNPDYQIEKAAAK